MICFVFLGDDQGKIKISMATCNLQWNLFTVSKNGLYTVILTNWLMKILVNEISEGWWIIV